MVVPSPCFACFSLDAVMNPSWPAFFLSLIGTFLLCLAPSWRWKVSGVALQYLSLFWLVQPHWSLTVAAVALVSGWMAAVVLTITMLSASPTVMNQQQWSEGRLFRFLMALLVALVSFALALRTIAWLGVTLPVAWSGVLLGGTGLLLLGLSQQDLDTILGLLTVLTGFEVLYASLEASILLAALLTLVHLGLALAAAYLLSLEGESS